MILFVWLFHCGILFAFSWKIIRSLIELGQLKGVMSKFTWRVMRIVFIVIKEALFEGF